MSFISRDLCGSSGGASFLLFGVLIPNYSNRNSTILLFTILDILKNQMIPTGFPRRTILRYLRKSHFCPYSKAPYITHWLYSKPSRKILQNPDRHNWTSMIQTLFKSSTIPGDGPDASLSNQEFILTSDLQLPNSSDSE